MVKVILAEGGCDLSDAAHSDKIDVCSALQGDFTIIRDKCIDRSLATMTASGVSKMGSEWLEFSWRATAGTGGCEPICRYHLGV